MIDLKKIKDVMNRKTTDKNLYLYDRKGQVIIFRDQSFVKEITNNFSPHFENKEDILLYTQIRQDSLVEGNRYINIPFVTTKVNFAIMEEFVDYVKEEDENISNQLKEELGGKGTFSRFEAKVKELNYYDKWIEFKDSLLEGFAYDWAINNNLIDSDYVFEAYEKLFEEFATTYSLNLWDTFKSNDLIHIKYDKHDYYFTIYGGENEFKGFTIILNEKGVDGLKLLDDNLLFNMSSNLTIACQNSYRMQYARKEDLNDEDLELIDGLKMDFKNGLYPQIQKLKEGFYPTNLVNETEAFDLCTALIALREGFKQYMEKPVFVNFDEYELFINLDKKEPTIGKRELNVIQDIDFLYDELDFSDVEIIDKTIEFNLDCLSTPIEPIVSNNPLWGYILIGYNVEKDLIDYHCFDTYDEHNALLNIQKNIIEEFLKTGFPKTIIYDNFIVLSMFSFLEGYGVDVVPGEISENMENIFDQIDDVEVDENDKMLN